MWDGILFGFTFVIMEIAVSFQIIKFVDSVSDYYLVQFNLYTQKEYFTPNFARTK